MDVVTIARSQFAVTTLFHMLWIILSIGLSLFVLIMEGLWLKTGDVAYYRHTRFWSGIFIVAFGIGIASGIPLEFQFGTNWSRFAAKSGQVVGNLLAYEAVLAFALETAFLAIFIFGWDRVSRRLHFFSSAMVVLGSTLSAFWIMAANSWMQTPAGLEVQAGNIVITDYVKAIFNPDLPIAFIHIWVACIESTVFFIGGICAWYMLRRQHVGFSLKAFKVALVAGIILAPLQIVLGDQSALTVIEHQPVKSAAMEAHWETNPPGEGAAYVVIAWPDDEAEANRWEVTVPYLLSFLDTRTLDGRVQGVKDFPPEDRPPVAIPFYAFRVMFLLGIAMVLLALWTLWLWLRRRLTPDGAPKQRLLLKLWLWSIPIGFIATDMGWVVREVGRQPWLVYGLVRTPDGVSPVSSAATFTTFALFLAVYPVVLGVFIHYLARTIRKGPDLMAPLPAKPGEK